MGAEHTNFGAFEMDITQTYNAITVAPAGLGYGKGSISVQDRLKNEADPLTQEVITQTERVILDKPMQQIADDDSDGCPDGRGTKRLLQGDVEIEQTVVRPKVFGGGLTMGMAGLISVGKASNTLAETFAASQTMFDTQGRNYGAHSADHAHGPNCGCGAIDQAPAIVRSALQYRDEIKNTILAVAGNSAESSDLSSRVDHVIANYQAFADANTDSEYTGTAVMSDIARNGKVIAELTDDHKEVRIVVNADIIDRTFNQEAVRAGTNGVAQVFTVDIPRLRSIANMFDTPEERADAFTGMLVYSFATAATLTKGDLPVDVIYGQSSTINY